MMEGETGSTTTTTAVENPVPEAQVPAKLEEKEKVVIEGGESKEGTANISSKSSGNEMGQQ